MWERGLRRLPRGRNSMAGKFREKSGAFLFAEQIVYAFLGTAVGMAVGAVGGIFGAGVDKLGAFGMAHFSLYVWFLPVVGVLTVAMLRIFGKNSPVGMGALFSASRGEIGNFPLRNAAFQFAGGWAAHLFCASVGREGAGVQIGAAIGMGIGKEVPLRDADKILLVAGMAAGFSALFGTPVCALFFALEVTVVGGIRLRALVASVFSAFAAYFTVQLCHVSHSVYAVSFDFALDVSLFLRVFVFGALCGIAGLIFCVARKYAAKFFAASCKNAYVRAAVAGLMLSCLLWLSKGRYSGLGTDLIADAFAGRAAAYDWIVKLLFTAVFLSVGFLGGEVTTLFAAGSCLGAAAGNWFGLDPAVAAALGYAAVFGAATNTLFAPVLLGVEIFGGASLPFMAIACLAAYLFNFGRSVYNQKVRETVIESLERRIRKDKPRVFALPERLYR